MLIGKKVSLRIAEPEDAQLLAGWYADPAYLGDFYNVWPESVRDWEQALSKDLDVTEKCTMLIERNASGEPIGTMGYYQPFTLRLYRALEIWYQVHPSARREGVATQAACLLVNHLFDALPVARVLATAVVGNEASSRVAQNAGMQYEGVMRSIVFIHGRPVDVNLYAITRDDWKDETTYRANRPDF
jgi:RimJ/RimL family protein N-acetyltransferase